MPDLTLDNLTFYWLIIALGIFMLAMMGVGKR